MIGKPLKTSMTSSAPTMRGIKMRTKEEIEAKIQQLENKANYSRYIPFAPGHYHNLIQSLKWVLKQRDDLE